MCNYPKTLKIKSKKEGEKIITVPCRRCLGCWIEKRNYYEDRIAYEVYKNMRNGIQSCFVTLTYTSEYVPIHNGYMTLLYEDVQKYFKKLRKIGHKFKYLVSGEYGGNNGRPHYHVLFIGISRDKKRELIKEWGKGIVDVKPIANGVIKYILSYIQKTPGKYKELYESKEIEKPFIHMSKSIGVDLYNDNEENIKKHGGYYKKGKYIPLNYYYAKKYNIRTIIKEKEEVYDKYRKAWESGMTYGQYMNHMQELTEEQIKAQLRNQGKPVLDRKS